MPETPNDSLKFLTAAEVAAMLKLNHQVLLRKLQSGEIPAYKIGKDWRVEESELRAWLESVSNRSAAKAEGPDKAETEVRNRFFEAGRLKTIPAQRNKRDIVLRMLIRRFEHGRVYREAEVNELLKSAHEDFCTLRRELIMARLLVREKGLYQRPAVEESAGGAGGVKERGSARNGRTAGGAPPSGT